MKKYYIKNYTDQAFRSESEVDTWLTDNLEEEFDENLDMLHGDFEINGAKYSASYILKEVDPIKYRCDYGDYVDQVMAYEMTAEEEEESDEEE